MKKIVLLPVFQKVVPADFEYWMESLALEGWNVDTLGQFSSLAMVFHKTEPHQYRYVFDLNAFPNSEYKSIYQQLGWEFVGQMSSCFVWRKSYETERPESFTDQESLQKRNKRVRNAVLVALTLFLVTFAALLVGAGICAYVGKTEKIIELGISACVAAAFSLYLWWVTHKINQNMER